MSQIIIKKKKKQSIIEEKTLFGKYGSSDNELSKNRKKYLKKIK